MSERPPDSTQTIYQNCHGFVKYTVNVFGGNNFFFGGWGVGVALIPLC